MTRSKTKHPNANLGDKKLNQTISTTQFVAIKKALTDTKDFGQNKHLELISAIYERDVETINNILFPTQTTIEKDSNIITALDKEGNNAILVALKKGVGIPQLASYISALEKEHLLSKISMKPELLEKIAYVIKHPVSQWHPVILIEDLIEKTYEEESLESLIDTIGASWLENYYS